MENGVNSLKLTKRVRSVEELKRSKVFEHGLGLVKDVDACLMLKEEAKPIMRKARSIPYPLREKVEK